MKKWSWYNINDDKKLQKQIIELHCALLFFLVFEFSQVISADLAHVEMDINGTEEDGALPRVRWEITVISMDGPRLNILRLGSEEGE